MSDTLKAARLDFFLVRQYIKSMLLILLYPMIIIVLNKALLNGVSFGICFLSMTSSYPFTISEKHGMNRLYGILPVSRKSMVLGRYLYTCIIGLTSLAFFLLVCPLVLRTLGTAVAPSDILVTALTGLLLFTVFTVFLLPGFYKFGSIKGRFFMFIPAVVFIALLALASFGGFESGPVVAAIDGNPLILAVAVVLFCAAAYALSISASVRIYRNKDQNND